MRGYEYRHRFISLDCFPQSLLIAVRLQQYFASGPSKMQEQRCSVIPQEIILMSQEMSLKLLRTFNKLLLGRMDFQPPRISARQSNYREALCQCLRYKIGFSRVYNYNMPIKIYLSLKPRIYFLRQGGNIAG